MLSIKKYFVIASLALGAQALAAPAAEVTGSPAAGTTGNAAAVAKAAPATGRQAARADHPAKPLLAEHPSSWSMLLVGAGVLLLPRKRRVDNSVR